ncbi:MAG: cupin domain-containing protein [Actinomycetota bacterium]|nr:cupin domain-containing protein [Actinomycetota bacterium]
MQEFDGMRIIGPTDGPFDESPRSKWRELISASETDTRWSLGEVRAYPDEGVATHFHPGEPEALIILDGEIELHGSQGEAQLHPGDVVFIPPDTEHGLRTPKGGRWLAIWPNKERVPGKRYAK